MTKLNRSLLLLLCLLLGGTFKASFAATIDNKNSNKDYFSGVNIGIGFGFNFNKFLIRNDNILQSKKKTGFYADLFLGYDKVLNNGLLLGANLGVGLSFNRIRKKDVALEFKYKSNGHLFLRPRIGYVFDRFAFGITPGISTVFNRLEVTANGGSAKEKLMFMPGAFVEFSIIRSISFGLQYDFIPRYNVQVSLPRLVNPLTLSSGPESKLIFYTSFKL